MKYDNARRLNVFFCFVNGKLQFVMGGLRRVPPSLVILALLISGMGGYEFFFGETTKRAEAAYTGKQLRTVEYALGSGVGTAATQTGTDNSGVARTSDDNVYAGSSWNITKGTAGTKTVQIPGSGIRVLSAYLDLTSALVTAIDVTDIEIALDVSPGIGAGDDVAVGEVARNGTGLVYSDTSGLSSPILSAKADVTSLFQTQTDGQWNTGLAVVGMLSVTGPTWTLATMKLVITYEQNYSEASHQEMKTVRFPLRSTASGDSGTKRTDCTVGTCSFSYLLDIPELVATADIVDAWFELSYIEDGASVLTPSINGGAAGSLHNPLEVAVDGMERFIIYRPAIGTPNLSNTAQTLDVGTTGTIAGLGGEIVVTYKFLSDAPTQTETVQYWMGQQRALPGTASSTFTQVATLVNGGANPKSIWFRVHDSVTNTPFVAIGGKVGNSATSGVTYTGTLANPRGGELRIIHDMGAATTSWSGASSTLSIDVRHQAATYDAAPGVEAMITFHWSGGAYGAVTKTGKFFAGSSGGVPALANSDNMFSFTVTLPETVTKTYRSSYLSTSVMHTDLTAILSGTVRISLSGGAPVAITEATEDLENFRAMYMTQATSTNFTPDAMIPWVSRAFATLVRGNQTEEYAANSEMVVTYDANLSGNDPEASEGKQLRTVEFVLGGGAGAAATQTGTDNNGVARASDDNVYAGSAWNSTKGSAGTKSVQIFGSGIRVLSAYLDTTSSVITSTDISNFEMTLDVSPGIASGEDIAADTVASNAATAIFVDNSGVSSPLLSAKANVTSLFQTQTDSQWNSGLAVVGMLSVTGPTWHLATMKLIVTYEEDYSLIPHTALKTVRFPLRSTQAGDSGTRRTDCAAGATCAFGYAINVPDLATTSDIVDAFFEISYVENAAADVTPSISGGAVGAVHNALEVLNDGMERFLLYRPLIGGVNLATSSQTLNIAVATAAIGGLGGEVVITYKYSTGATIQTETVQYWMGQAAALPATASSSYTQSATILNGSSTVKNLWYKVHDSVTNTPFLAVGGKIGNSATTGVTYTATLSLPRGGEMRIIHDMGAATSSWSGTTTTLSIDVRHQAATYDAAVGVEAFITFHWAGNLNGPVTKTGKFFGGSSSAVPALANSDNSIPFVITLPETVTKTYRSSYLSTSVMHTDATSIIPGTVRISLSGGSPVTISEGTEDAENFRAIYLTQATSTNFTFGAPITWNTRAFQTLVRGNQTEEYAANSEMVLTYDTNFQLKAPVLQQDYFRYYVNNNALLPTDPWPAGAVNLSENTNITALDVPPDSGDVVRLRMSFNVSTTTLLASSTAFTLQYGTPTSTCGNLGGTWSAVGGIGSGSIWRGFNTAVADETNLSGDPPTGGDLVLSLSDRAGTFEEVNNSKGNPFAVFIGEDVEYDWVLQDNGAATNTDYCFRMAYSGGTSFGNYAAYPMIRTAGYTPKSRNWKWYDDETNETPTTALAGENIAPVNLKLGDIAKLRITASDTRGHSGVNQKFRLQYSTFSDFSSGVGFVTATSSCTTAWCYANGVDTDGSLITALLLTDSAAFGTHNEAPTTTATIDPLANTAYEFEYTITHAGAAANTTYFFRLYDVNNSVPVPIDTGKSYPSLSTGDTTLTFAVLGVVSGSSTPEGIVTTIATTPTAVPFGTLGVGVSEIGAHTLHVNTNATDGYQVLVSETQNFISAGGAEIPGVAASNTTPMPWATACTATSTGCFGYHAGDNTLFGGSPRFAPNDTWAEFETPAREVMYGSVPATATDTADVIFRVERHILLPAGQYETMIRYIVVPTF